MNAFVYECVFLWIQVQILTFWTIKGSYVYTASKSCLPVTETAAGDTAAYFNSANPVGETWTMLIERKPSSACEWKTGTNTSVFMNYKNLMFIL